MKQCYLLLLFIPNFLHGQYCLSGGPSSTADSQIESVVFNGVTGSINYLGCPGVTGVEEQLTQTVFIDAGNSYYMDIQFGTCGGNYSGAGEAWIDYNGDQIFDTTESIGTWTGTPPTTLSTFNFTVPISANTGACRLRVMQREGGSLPLDPCESFTWGSVIDFNIYIQNGVDCSSFIGDDETDPRMVTSIPFTETYNSQICYSNQNLVYSSPDVYYLITPITMSSLNISLCGSTFDTFLSIVSTDGTVLSVNDDHPSCGSSSQVDINASGHDSLYVIVEGWSNQSGDYEINITESTAKINENSSINYTVFPNPINGNFTIGQSFNGSIRLLTSNGKQVLKSEVAPNQTIDVSQLPTGLYFLELTTDKNSYTQKITLQ
ncbi:MAG: T9SS type A sorting domain-containing protein [Crocinitomicaceae bacterium]|nr:T9SS type A sorting domain-containing protein [Crocinitomicaceae bacterium]